MLGTFSVASAASCVGCLQSCDARTSDVRSNDAVGDPEHCNVHNIGMYVRSASGVVTRGCRVGACSAGLGPERN
jgi:hypothetical protein